MALSISFKGSKVLVTGAAGGLGRDLVEILHRQDAIVFALARNAGNLAALKKEFPNIQTVLADLSDWEGTRKAVEDIGPVDYLINNAGVAILAPFMNIQPEHFDTQMGTNVKAAMCVSQVVAQHMIARGQGGCIINVSSMGGKVPTMALGMYDASKAALDMLTKSMAVELGPYNIRVNSVNPTLFPSGMTKNYLDKNPGGDSNFLSRIPLRRHAESREIVNTILFLMSDKAPMINATSILIDGGYCAN